VAVRLGDGTVQTAPLSSLLAPRHQALLRQLSILGSTPASIYRIGPDADLIGQPLSKLPVEPSENAGVDLDGRELLNVVDRRTDLLPTWIQAGISGLSGAEPPDRDRGQRPHRGDDAHLPGRRRHRLRRHGPGELIAQPPERGHDPRRSPRGR
jgi:hypothetical protein